MSGNRHVGLNVVSERSTDVSSHVFDCQIELVNIESKMACQTEGFLFTGQRYRFFFRTGETEQAVL